MTGSARGSRVVFGGPLNRSSVAAAVSAAIRISEHRVSLTLLNSFFATFLLQLWLTIKR